MIKKKIENNQKQEEMAKQLASALVQKYEVKMSSRDKRMEELEEKLENIKFEKIKEINKLKKIIEKKDEEILMREKKISIESSEEKKLLLQTHRNEILEVKEQFQKYLKKDDENFQKDIFKVSQNQNTQEFKQENSSEILELVQIQHKTIQDMRKEFDNNSILQNEEINELKHIIEIKNEEISTLLAKNKMHCNLIHAKDKILEKVFPKPKNFKSYFEENNSPLNTDSNYETPLKTNSKVPKYMSKQ